MVRSPLIALASVLTLSAGCLGSYGLSPGDGGGGDAGVKDLAPAVDPVADYHAKVEPILNAACAGCHDKAGGVGIGFLAPPDTLTSLLSFPGLVGPTPDQSRIYVKGTHEGPALTMDQKPIVGAWISEWNVFKPPSMDAGAPKPYIKPFVPVMGANSVDLSVLDPTLAGMTITFTAQVVGSSTLELTQIMVNPTAASGIHIAHPLFVTWDAQYNPTPDPVDSFSNVDETVPAGQSQALGPGQVFLQGWASGEMLNLVFTTIEAKMSANGDGGVLNGCKNVGSFTTNAVPQLQNAQTSAGNTCVGCHGGGNASATAAFSLQGLTSNPSMACVSVRGEVTPTAAAMSNLFKNVNGTVTHQGGTLSGTTLTNFTNNVTLWINAEQ